MGPCKGQLNLKCEVFNMLLLKHIFIYFFSNFETDLIKSEEKQSKIKERIENGNRSEF